MKRRDFIKHSVSAAIVSGTFFTTNKLVRAMASENQSSALSYDMIAIKNGSPVTMFDKAIAAMGGMKNFVQPNQTVVVKPNIGWDAIPEKAANTNPLLVGRIVEHCFKAGAKTVYVFDNTCNEWTRCYKNSGIEAQVKAAGGTMVTGKSEGHYHTVEIPKGKTLKKNKVHELILESDVFINVPVLKHHGGAQLSICMKNLMGIVWDRGYYHGNGLHQCIADFTTFKKPDLNIVDAYRVMKRNGPRGVSVEDAITMKYQLIGTDMVALDTAAAKIFGIDPSRVRHISLAEQLGTGVSNLDSLKINRISL